ncbi:hypothetical protein BGX29_004000 [Mortierella sp. GBA35]|nr:hypothetical protein BGX29_004000 [Mortierella sp. GBA35]
MAIAKAATVARRDALENLERLWTGVEEEAAMADMVANLEKLVVYQLDEKLYGRVEME